ncbi:MAG: [citrate (pro-3S)-lyase] ligase [Clostridiaceae bacterium]
MITISELNLKLESNRKKLSEFLQGFGLKDEELDRMYILLEEDGKWVGCGGKSRNILKCFAIDDSRRNEGLLDLLMTALITDSYNEGFENLFIYTKSEYASMFKSYGFIEIIDTKTITLLQRGPASIEKVLKDMEVSIDEHESVGAIVVNANPFTLGHRYLIEISSLMVDKLLVFVVENDVSRFSFKDRYYLVKSQVEDLLNVIVLPSSEYIVSNATFPSYFLKESTLADREHAILDAMIFKKYFVPWFHISKRFLGEEPLDKSTNLYNETLMNTLPPECEVIVIPRKLFGTHFISASNVRKELDSGNFDAIKELVPEGTLRYLKENYGKHS